MQKQPAIACHWSDGQAPSVRSSTKVQFRATERCEERVKGICKVSSSAAAALGLLVHATLVKVSFVSIRKGDLVLVKECVAFLKRKSVSLLNTHTGSAALRACFASGMSDSGNEREDIALCWAGDLSQALGSW